ncbi:MAG TPA: serine/threonine-protein kinase, partial [Pirellulaceae bacterium]|nr:serine/threonine-protein kinase [Pirellulaceae bacterium]
MSSGSRDRSSADESPSLLEDLTTEQQERLTQVLDQYLSALEQGVPPKPEAFLTEHPDLAGPLEFYLASLNQLHEVSAGFVGRDNAAPPAEQHGEKRLGDFVLGNEIGRGGMGVVYEAQQLSLDRRVAVKVLPFAAVLDGKQIARFKNEAQAAAQLHHPHIVPVFAIGAERGVHFYAMQLIEGQPLDQLVTELKERRRQPASAAKSYLVEKAASPTAYYRAVAQLGIQAAEALQAAHEFGIVHRDIKPSNLLLDHAGKVWVTDFGLARFQRDVSLTRTGDLVGTLRYMSPEQALGQAGRVDERTDIYSLGATLYELLAWEAAFPDEQAQSLLRRIEQQEPKRPSLIRAGVPAELEAVVLKAMSKQREERYDTAEEFAADLRRIVAGQPPLAKLPTLFDRGGKWLRNHRRIAAAITGVSLLLLVGATVATVLITREKYKAEQNYARAEQNFRAALEAVDRLGGRAAERLIEVPAAEPIRRELLQETLTYYRKFAAAASDDPALRPDLAATYGKIGTLSEQLGERDAAIDAYRQAVELLQQVSDSAKTFDNRQQLAIAQDRFALALARFGKTADAGRAFAAAITEQEQLLREQPHNEQLMHELARSYGHAGLLQSAADNRQESERALRSALDLRQRLSQLAPQDTTRLSQLATAYSNLGSLFTEQHPARAIENLTAALKAQEQATSLQPSDAALQAAAALIYNQLGTTQAQANQPEAALVSYQKSLTMLQTLVANAPAKGTHRRDLASVFNNLGLLQTKQTQYSDAITSFEQALAQQRPLAEEYPDDLGLQSSLGSIYNNLGMAREA